MSTTPRVTKLALGTTVGVTGVAAAVFAIKRPTPVPTTDVVPFLWLFSALFAIRVAGQVLVRLKRPRWLPPTEDWNLSPYRVLLPTQLALLGLIVWIDVCFTLGRGAAADPRPRLGDCVLVFAYVYAAVMVARYAVRMRRRPAERWFGGTIPIVFHLVLAAYLFVFGSFHASY